MKKVILLSLPFLVIIPVFIFFQTVQNKNSGRGALQVTSVSHSQVYLNGKLIGKTPLCKCDAVDMLPIGEYTIKLVPQSGGFSQFQEKITIGRSVLTVVDRSFGQGAEGSGSIITLSPLENNKALELLVLSVPNGAETSLDNNSQGATPVLLKNITDSDHEIKLTRSGYKEKTVRIRTVLGYKLTATVFLGVQNDLSQTQQASPSATPVPTVILKRALILQTPTGFLRVRAEPSSGSAEIAQVNPGDSFEISEEQVDWVRIKLLDGTLGWVSSQYTQVQ